MARRKKNVPKDETKKDRFKRIVEPRVRKALKSIRLIGNCFGSAYEFSSDDCIEIFAAIERELDSLKAVATTKGVATIDFELS